MLGKFFVVCVSHYLCVLLLLKAFGFVLPDLTICYHSGVVGVLFSSVIAFFTFGLTRSRLLREKIRAENRAVLITGCDSGFGHHLAKRLDSKGYHVFAACLFPTESGALSLTESCSQRLKVLGMDVTKDESVEKAVEFVKSNLGSCELWAVVNNAGIHAGFSVQVSFMKDFQYSFDVNSKGPARVTKAFLPLLIQSKGRVVTVTSIAGRTIIPNITAYIMSKHAAVAFSDCLRQEVASLGVRVISIEPEIFKTNLTDFNTARKKLEATIESLNDTESQFKERHKKVFLKRTEIFLRFASPRIELVIDDLESAVSAMYPSSIYRPSRHIFSTLCVWIYEMIPVSVRDFIVKVLLFLTDRVYG